MVDNAKKLFLLKGLLDSDGESSEDDVPNTVSQMKQPPALPESTFRRKATNRYEPTEISDESTVQSEHDSDESYNSDSIQRKKIKRRKSTESLKTKLSSEKSNRKKVKELKPSSRRKKRENDIDQDETHTRKIKEDNKRNSLKVRKNTSSKEHLKVDSQRNPGDIPEKSPSEKSHSEKEGHRIKKRKRLVDAQDEITSRRVESGKSLENDRRKRHQNDDQENEYQTKGITNNEPSNRSQEDRKASSPTELKPVRHHNATPTTSTKDQEVVNVNGSLQNPSEAPIRTDMAATETTKEVQVIPGQAENLDTTELSASGEPSQPSVAIAPIVLKEIEKDETTKPLNASTQNKSQETIQHPTNEANRSSPPLVHSNLSRKEENGEIKIKTSKDISLTSRRERSIDKLSQINEKKITINTSTSGSSYPIEKCTKESFIIPKRTSSSPSISNLNEKIDFTIPKRQSNQETIQFDYTPDKNISIGSYRRNDQSTIPVSLPIYTPQSKEINLYHKSTISPIFPIYTPPPKPQLKLIQKPKYSHHDKQFMKHATEMHSYLRSMSKSTHTYDVIDKNGEIYKENKRFGRSMSSNCLNEQAASFYGIELNCSVALRSSKECHELKLNEEMDVHGKLNDLSKELRDLIEKHLFNLLFLPLTKRYRTTVLFRNMKYENKSGGIIFNSNEKCKSYAKLLSQRYKINNNIPNIDIPITSWKELQGGNISFLYCHYYSMEDAQEACRIFYDDQNISCCIIQDGYFLKPKEIKLNKKKEIQNTKQNEIDHKKDWKRKTNDRNYYNERKIDGRYAIRISNVDRISDSTLRSFLYQFGHVEYIKWNYDKYSAIVYYNTIENANACKRYDGKYLDGNRLKIERYEN